jgi:acetolactate synthase-1/2/3 large subunit
MGFGLPGAIGAALARPGETVLACIGDGALALSMGDLLTAVREAVDLVVVVFNDGGYGLIRRQQLLTLGHAVATNLPAVDYQALAQATGCSYFRADVALDETLRAVALAKGVRLLEVPLAEASSMAAAAFKRAVRETVARAAPDGALRWIKGVLGR